MLADEEKATHCSLIGTTMKRFSKRLTFFVHFSTSLYGSTPFFFGVDSCL